MVEAILHAKQGKLIRNQQKMDDAVQRDYYAERGLVVVKEANLQSPMEHARATMTPAMIHLCKMHCPRVLRSRQTFAASLHS